jgi:hypothetical protein
MIERATGGPAFPTDTGRQINPSTFHLEGMTLRDYFASKCIGSLCAEMWPRPSDFEQIAKLSYGMADAMIAERAK